MTNRTGAELRKHARDQRRREELERGRKVIQERYPELLQRIQTLTSDDMRTGLLPAIAKKFRLIDIEMMIEFFDEMGWRTVEDIVGKPPQ